MFCVNPSLKGTSLGPGLNLSNNSPPNPASLLPNLTIFSLKQEEFELTP